MKTLNLKFITRADLRVIGFNEDMINRIRMVKYAVAEYEVWDKNKPIDHTIQYVVDNVFERVLVNRNWYCITDNREEFIEFMT